MLNEKVQETKLFSAQVQDAAWLTALRAGSVSDADANSRKNEYGKLFSKYENMKEAYKMFSGVTEMPLLSNQYFNATVASFVRSFAGYLTIERDMAEPTALLWFDDVLGVVNEKVVLPNIGKEDLEGIDQAISYEDVTITAATTEISGGKVIVPGSFKGVLKLTDASDNTQTYELNDDTHGNILAAPGVLSAGEINYKTGAIKFTIAATYASGTYSVHAAADVPGTPVYGTIANNQSNRFKLDMKNILVSSEADMLIGESNLVAMAQANKSLGQNPMQVMGAKLVEMYTKLINNKIVATIKSAAAGNAYTINTTAWATQFYDFNSRLNAFSSEMVNVDTLLAEKSVKGVEATAYVVGTKAGNWFRQMRATGEFVEEKGSTYINDLLGTYHDIPVLRHNGIDSNKIYAVHKTAGGELAPCMFGQYLPLTWTPNIGSYSNPSQVAAGVFFQNGIKTIASELVQEVTLVL
jgi:hypothetical protein